MSAEPRFSEAMWFKKGEVEEEATELNAPPEDARIEERYQDDGSLTQADLARYNLRTGRTEPVFAIRSATATPAPAPAPGLFGNVRIAPIAIAATGAILTIGVLARLLS